MLQEVHDRRNESLEAENVLKKSETLAARWEFMWTTTHTPTKLNKQPAKSDKTIKQEIEMINVLLFKFALRG